MITVWGRSSSANVQKVIWTMDELNVPYERLDRGREFGGLDTPEYLQNNPNGRIPTVQDGDLFLWESQSICRYLTRKYNGDHLLPTDPAAAFNVEKWMDWNIAHLAASMFPMFQEAREAKDKAVGREPRFAKSTAAAQQNMDVMQSVLSGHDYLAGDSFTLADLVCSITVARWLFMDFDFGSRSNVEAWYNRVSARPFAQSHNVVSF